MDIEPWAKEDFSDPPRPENVEDDPWSLSPRSSGETAEDSTSTRSRAPLTAETPRADSEGIQPIDTFAEADRVMQDESGEPSFDDLQADAAVEFDTLDDVLLYLDVSAVHTEHYDEPTPEAEYDAELSEPLYEPDINTTDLPRLLVVDEFIANIADTTDDQHSEIYEVLLSLSNKKRSSLIQWMRGKKWTGHSLALFLGFRTMWYETPPWWQYTFWHQRMNEWWTYSNVNYLSRDACYALIQSRLHCHPEEVIDEEWFEDWNDFKLCEYGFHSFASFAQFRAEINDTADWKVRIDWTLKDEDPYRTEDKDHSSHIRMYEPDQWFAYQNWYDHAE